MHGCEQLRAGSTKFLEREMTTEHTGGEIVEAFGGRTFVLGILFLLASTYQIWLGIVSGIELTGMSLTITTEAGGLFAIVAGNVAVSSAVPHNGKKGWRKLATGVIYLACATFIILISIKHKIPQPELAAAMTAQVAGVSVVIWGNVKEKAISKVESGTN
jgi:hypothetical protein